MSVWKIDGMTFASIGGQNLRMQQVGFGIDVVTFTVVCNYDSVPLWTEGSTLSITKDNVQWFKGRLIGISHRGDGNKEAIDYELAGPWWYMENTIHLQEWLVGNSGSQHYIQNPRTVLNQNKYGYRMDSAYQITEALNFVLTAAGHNNDPATPFQIGTIQPTNVQKHFVDVVNSVTQRDVWSYGVDCPWEFMDGLTCAEVIQKMIRWSPDCVGYFDYSVDPPRFNIYPRVVLSEVAMTVPSNVVSVDITPRYDLIRPCVAIQYRTPLETGTGLDYVDVVVEKYPPEASGWEWGTLLIPIDLGGYSASYDSGEVTVELADYLSQAWWIARHPELDTSKNPLVMATWQSGSRDNIGSSCTKEILGGAIPSWSSYDTEDETFRAKFRVMKYSDASRTKLVSDTIEEITHTCKVTNVPNSANPETIPFVTMTSCTLPEVMPTGLARDCYNSLKDLHYQGRLPVKEQEPSDTYRIGKVLNIVGGKTEWETMAALIQQVQINVDTGETEMVFGPPTHLGVPDMVELLRRARRRIIAPLYERSTGKNGASGGTPSGSNSSQDKTNSKTEKVSLITIEEAT